MSNYNCKDMVDSDWCHDCHGCVNCHNCEECVDCRNCFAIVGGRSLVGYNGSILDVLEVRLKLLLGLTGLEVKA